MYTDLTCTKRPYNFRAAAAAHQSISTPADGAAAAQQHSRRLKKALLGNDDELMAYVADILGEAKKPRKEATHRQPATAEAIRDLCAVHIVSLEEMFETAHLTRTPQCLWRPASRGQQRLHHSDGDGHSSRRARSSLGYSNSSSSTNKKNSSGASELSPWRFAVGDEGACVTGRPRTVREVLEHDHRCRSATALYELAKTCHRMADEISTRHKREVANLKQQLASVKRCVVEWEACFGKDPTVTPATVGAELRSLRQQVADLQRENEELRTRHAAFRVQHDSLVNYYTTLQ